MFQPMRAREIWQHFRDVLILNEVTVPPVSGCVKREKKKHRVSAVFFLVTAADGGHSQSVPLIVPGP